MATPGPGRRSAEESRARADGRPRRRHRPGAPRGTATMSERTSPPAPDSPGGDAPGGVPRAAWDHSVCVRVAARGLLSAPQRGDQRQTECDAGHGAPIGSGNRHERRLLARPPAGLGSLARDAVQGSGGDRSANTPRWARERASNASPENDLKNLANQLERGVSFGAASRISRPRSARRGVSRPPRVRRAAVPFRLLIFDCEAVFGRFSATSAPDQRPNLFLVPERAQFDATSTAHGPLSPRTRWRSNRRHCLVCLFPEPMGFSGPIVRGWPRGSLARRGGPRSRAARACAARGRARWWQQQASAPRV